MAVEQYANIIAGPITRAAIVESFMSSSTNLPLWAPVKLAAAGTNETLPRVTTTTSADDKIIGITCGPKKSSGFVADVAGDTVQVITFGAAKCKVLGASSTIAIATPLTSTTTAGQAGAIAATNRNGFALSLFAGVTDGDIIPVYVKGSISLG